MNKPWTGDHTGPRNRPETTAQMDTLAEHMAEGCPSIIEASRRMGIAQQRANVLWGRIRAELGAQAV
jgi:hypothetical protein